MTLQPTLKWSHTDITGLVDNCLKQAQVQIDGYKIASIIPLNDGTGQWSLSIQIEPGAPKTKITGTTTSDVSTAN